jgi:hypothetical protein
MGAILQCPDPRVQSIVSDLRQDDLAREIIGRVDSGPYVRALIETWLFVISLIPYDYRVHLVAGHSLQMQRRRTSLLQF